MKGAKINILEKENQVVFWLDSRIYSKEIIFRSAYVFVDRAYLYLDGDPKKNTRVFLKGKEKLNRKKLETLGGEFLNELLNQMARENISKNNRKLLEYIVGGAISASLNKGSEEENDSENDKEALEIEKEIADLKKELEQSTIGEDYAADPLGIRKIAGKKKKNNENKR
jgi:His-Xaa-Ser system protein HxsD